MSIKKIVVVAICAKVSYRAAKSAIYYALKEGY
jgi:hypothetical protein